MAGLGNLTNDSTLFTYTEICRHKIPLHASKNDEAWNRLNGSTEHLYVQSKCHKKQRCLLVLNLFIISCSIMHQQLYEVFTQQSTDSVECEDSKMWCNVNMMSLLKYRVLIRLHRSFFFLQLICTHRVQTLRFPQQCMALCIDDSRDEQKWVVTVSKGR